MNTVIGNIFGIIFLMATFSWAQDTQEIRVHLPTISPLQPIYVSKVHVQQAAFDAAYLVELEAVLQRDLNYNGSTKVSAKSIEKEQLLEKPSSIAFCSTTWKNFGVPYVLKWEIAQKTLRVVLF